MALLDELLQEKRKKVFGESTQQKLTEVSGVEVVVDNPDNNIVKNILMTNGHLSKSTPATMTYINNIRNKKIALILSKFGNPEI